VHTLHILHILQQLQLTLGHLQGALSLGASPVRKELLTFFTPA
jgi:hypothetical protein